MTDNVLFQGQPVKVAGTFPQPGTSAPAFSLVNGELKDVTADAFAGKRKVVSVFPSVDTGVCAASVREFNRLAAGMPDAVVLCVSADLPFAQGRFCASEGLDNVVMLSSLRGGEEFSDAWGVRISSGPLAGLMTRAVVVLDRDNTVLYSARNHEITEEPDYSAALAALK